MSGDTNWEALREAAAQARKNAHAPYSGFYVGAAILANGRIFAGCNVENASYPVGTCAERGAISAAVAEGCTDFEAVVVIAGPLTAPCGMCRQALAEFNPKVPIKLYSQDEQTDMLATLEAYLPDPFLG